MKERSRKNLRGGKAPKKKRTKKKKKTNHENKKENQNNRWKKKKKKQQKKKKKKAFYYPGAFALRCPSHDLASRLASCGFKPRHFSFLTQTHQTKKGAG